MLLSQLSRVALGEVSENLLELLLDLGLHYLFGLYAGEDIRAGGLDVIQQVSLILLDLVNCDILEEVVDNSVDNDYLLLYFQRRVLILLEHLNDTLALCKTILCILIKVGTELCEALQLSVLGVIQLQGTCDLLHRLYLRVAAYTGYGDTRVYSGTYAGVEQFALEVYLTVGDGNYVGRDIRGNVACLGLDDRQRGQRTSAVVLVKSCRTLEKS